ncbi:MAG TPA: rod shape-determining protein RodA [Acidimicrobiales bacterium]|nr:rod shape-determining protein RodA [Acidimicrobiales bacterium]
MNYVPIHATRRSRQAHLVTARIDVLLACTAVLLSIIGVVMVYSATRSQLILHGDDPRYYLKRQLLFMIIGVVVMVVMTLFDYRRLEHVSTLIYLGTLFLLVAVLAVGSTALGAQRWFPIGPFQLQPSEFATLAVIITFATYCARRPEGLVFKDMVRLVLMAGIPIVIIIKQPDLGTGIVMSMILLVMLGAAGLPGRYLLLLVVGLVVLVLVTLQVGLLQHYQIERLTSFISPNKASTQATYNVTQAKNAIGAGGWFGTGLFKGAQTNLAYVPSQQTDFIFSAVGEQLGFVGTAAILGLFGLVAWRILRTAQLARDNYGRLLCTGVFTLIVFSVFENVGMNMGIMPVAGIPLPFLSYGGSAIVGFFAAVGLVLNVHMRSVR